MQKEEFLKKLDKNLNKLSKKAKNEELAKYENLADYNLEPQKEAKKIYEARGISTENQLKFLEALNIIIKKLKNKDQKTILNIFLFFLYLLVMIIIIKIPFIYTRDMILGLFNNLFQKDIIYILWNLLFEALYAITAILILIRLIKKKALQLEETTKNDH